MTVSQATPLEFVVGPDDARDRADLLCVQLLARAGRPTTRADVQRWMAEGKILVDGKPARRGRPVPVGARLAVEPGAPLRSAAAPDATVPFRVVYEDEHLLVIDKPAKVVVHPARGHRTGTLVSGLLAHAQAAQAGAAGAAGDVSRLLPPADPLDRDGHLRPGIVHRLDKDTSGLLVVAKSAAVREALKALLARHDVERRYTAIVVGRARRASYDTPYGRDPRSRLRFTSRLPAERAGARRAVTHVEPLEQLGSAALVRCTLETGRTHQIRVHLAEQAGTAVLGDALYGKPPADPELRALGERLGRHALHAGVLGFVHPATGHPVRWESPLPSELGQALDELRARAARSQP
jgi:23S rRNA pseudouridine1911/1915/1917 synthase